MKLAIVGSRTFTDYDLLEKTISENYTGITEIISGGATGADNLAEMYAEKHGIPVTVFLPNWNEYGKKAGYLRNIQIVRAADTVIAFWDGVSKGTKITIDLANKEKKELRVVGGHAQTL